MKKIFNISLCVLLFILMNVSFSSCLSKGDKFEIKREAILVELDNLEEDIASGYIDPEELQTRLEDIEEQVEQLGYEE